MFFEFTIIISDCVFRLFPEESPLQKCLSGILKCFVVISRVCIFSSTYIVHLNHAVRKANAPEMLSDGEYISDVEEGICKFLL